MGNRYGRRSKHARRTIRPELQETFDETLKHADHSLLEGHRGEEAQNREFDEGDSQVRWPDGRHNKYPSDAVDGAPYPIEWGTKVAKRNEAGEIVGINWKGVWNLCRFYYFAGMVVGIGAKLGHKIRFGGDWDGDLDLNDQKFRDLVHFEYRGPIE